MNITYEVPEDGRKVRILPYDFRGKVAFVTGGSNGIGKAIAQRLLDAGSAVVIADISDKGKTLVDNWKTNGYHVIYAEVDVRRTQQLENAVVAAESAFGPLDVLVNNAGIFPRATLDETSDALWDQIMDINLKGVFHSCKACIPSMIKNGGGSIINIGSLNTFGGTPELFAYSTSKGGIASLTQNLARSFAKDKIRVNCVHPGWVVTEGELDIQRQLGQPDDWTETAGSQLPLGRLQTPIDIANAVMFFASDEADQVTGQSISVDGGLGFHY